MVAGKYHEYSWQQKACTPEHTSKHLASKDRLGNDLVHWLNLPFLPLKGKRGVWAEFKNATQQTRLKGLFARCPFPGTLTQLVE